MDHLTRVERIGATIGAALLASVLVVLFVYWSVQVWHGSIPFQEFSGR